MITRADHFVCVITYQYEDRIVEIPSSPTSRAQAVWLFGEQPRLFDGNAHVIRAAVYSEADYARHVRRFQ